MSRGLRLVALAAATALVASGCATDQSDDEVRTLRLSHFMEATHPHEECGFTAMNENLKGSNLRVETYPAAQLGGEARSLELVNTDNLDMSINGPSFLGVYDERFNALDAAYAFDDAESQRQLDESGQMDAIYDGYYERTGMKVFRGWYYGTRHVTADKPITSREALASIKLRAPDAPLYRINVGAMGGSVTPMALNELYMGLQQGVVDGQENPLPTIDTMGLYNVQSDLSLTGHMVQTLHISVSERTWESLSRDEQESLTVAIDAGAQAAYECVVNEENEILKEYRDQEKMHINEVDDSVFKDPVRQQLRTGYAFSETYSDLVEAQSDN